jgi:drug/metabolite transporter (DMT)-like permease
VVWIGLIFTLIGVVVVAVSDTCSISAGRMVCPSLSHFVQGRAFFGDLLALCGAIAGAGYLLIGRKLRAHMSLVGYISLVYGMAAIVLIVIMLSAGESAFGYSPETYLWLILLAVIPQLIGHSSFNWALGYLSAAYVSITLLGEPIGSTILAYFILNEKPTFVKLIGGGLILAGIYIASRSETGQTPELPD